ncbi:MAG: zinc-ribbon domain-containing protein [Methanobrevibacter sp.]|uniref:zinc-ribbon domain-containing protein n=1 Tax=Methanobrevibacter sp. TaxID=66852 RepID=UPI0025E1DE9C|nr:zinc-ribbon domain-containing protein [Methanobrevibacter sp.]MBR0272037.1 zinc-ribbon domain-containing protein [Methanobrevibacter sp.]
MFCPKCGKEINDGSKFCKHCGNQIKQPNTVSDTPSSSNSSGDDKTKKIIIGVLIAAIAVLAIVLVGFGTGMFNGDSSDSATADSQVQQETPSKSVSLSSFPVSEAPALAQAIKSSGGNFPVQFQSLSLSKAQCLYILSKSITLIGSGDSDASISVGDPSYAAHPSGRDNSQTIARENYVDMSNRFSSWIERNSAVPNYVGVYSGGVADISPSRMLDICVSIMIDYGNTHSLPASVNI